MTFNDHTPAAPAMGWTGRPAVALIAGPTASGKSALAIALALELRKEGRQAVIINADASQVYSDIPILSAQPSPKEREGIAHRLFGHVDGAIAYNAAQWAADATAAITDAVADGAIPILVGGTGLYIDTLLRGIAPVPPIPENIRASIRALPVGEAYRQLQSADPGAAARFKPLDKTRIARALEVIMATGTPLSDWQMRRVGGIADRIALTPAILLPPRDWLHERCDARLAAMFAGGAIDEVRTLLERQLDPSLPVMNAIGVPQIAAWLTGEFDPEQSHDWPLAHSRNATRRYAKRQYTWFRNQPPHDWPRIELELNSASISQLVIKLRNDILTS